MKNSELHRGFSHYLGLEYHPVGVKLYDDQEAFDSCEAVQRNNKLFYCHLVKKAAEGGHRKADVSNFACETSAKLLGLEDFYETEEGIQGWYETGLYASEELAETEHYAVSPVRNHIKGVEVGPLGQIERQADVVIIICNPYQAMRLVQGYTYHHGYKKDFQMSGMCGVCFESTVLPLRDQEFSVSLLCSGTRFVAQWPENMMMVAFPYSMVDKVLDGVKVTAKRCEPDANKSKIIERMDEDELRADSEKLQSKSAYFYKV